LVSDFEKKAKEMTDKVKKEEEARRKKADEEAKANTEKAEKAAVNKRVRDEKNAKKTIAALKLANAKYDATLKKLET
jgi:hypothetical protein